MSRRLARAAPPRPLAASAALLTGALCVAVALWPTAPTGAAGSGAATDQSSTGTDSRQARAFGWPAVLHLPFPYEDPARATVGPNASIHGHVRSLPSGALDFHGRAEVSVPGSTIAPRSDDFSVAVRVRLTRGAGDWNVVQHGLWNDPGQWKVSVHKASGGVRVSCRIKTDRAEAQVYAPAGLLTVDGPWSVVQCSRKDGRIEVAVDDIVVRGAVVPGDIDPGRRVTIGSKGLNTNDSDQFLGQLGYVLVTRRA